MNGDPLGTSLMPKEICLKVCVFLINNRRCYYSLETLYFLYIHLDSSKFNLKKTGNLKLYASKKLCQCQGNVI